MGAIGRSSSIDFSIGTSNFMLASFLVRGSWSRDNLKFSPTFPEIEAAFLISSSRDPNLVYHLLAVLGPTPGMPGILSDVSPTSAR